MTTLPTPRRDPVGSEVTPLISGSLRGRRRRPSGEPPPLPRHIDRSTRWYLLLAGLAGALWAGMSVPAALGVITRADLAALQAAAAVRTAWLTRLMLDVNVLASPWTVRVLAFSTIAVLVVWRRFQHLAAYLVIVLAAILLISAMTLQIGRMRPGRDRDPRSMAGVLAAVAARGRAGPGAGGGVYTLVPAGRWRNRGKWAAAIIIGAFCAARLYLAVDHPTDQLTALIIGWLLAVVGSAWRSRATSSPSLTAAAARAHLDIGGRRGEAIVTALDQQLGLAVVGVEPFGLGASAAPLLCASRSAARAAGTPRCSASCTR